MKTEKKARESNIWGGESECSGDTHGF